MAFRAKGYCLPALYTGGLYPFQIVPLPDSSSPFRDSSNPTETRDQSLS